MTTTPPDDDPLFAQWVADTAPDKLPSEIRVRRPVVAATAIVAATAGWGVALTVAVDLILQIRPLATAITVILLGTACALSALMVLVVRAK